MLLHQLGAYLFSGLTGLLGEESLGLGIQTRVCLFNPKRALFLVALCLLQLDYLLFLRLIDGGGDVFANGADRSWSDTHERVGVELYSSNLRIPLCCILLLDFLLHRAQIILVQ